MFRRVWNAYVRMYFVRPIHKLMNPTLKIEHVYQNLYMNKQYAKIKITKSKALNKNMGYG